MNSYIYIRNTKRNPVGCISFNVEEVDNTAKVSFSLSVCAKEDQKKFTKKLARSIADERASLKKTVVLTGLNKTTRGGYVREILTFLSKAHTLDVNMETSVPTSVKSFCKRWLKEKEEEKSSGKKNEKKIKKQYFKKTDIKLMEGMVTGCIPEAAKTTEVNLAS
jgi:hypothetical protein